MTILNYCVLSNEGYQVNKSQCSKYASAPADEYRVKPKKYVYYDGNEKPSDFETAAAALDITLNSIGDTIGDVGLSMLGKPILFTGKCLLYAS